VIANALGERPRGCPDRDTLFAFSVGRLPQEVRETVAGHVGDCALCLSALEALDDSADPAVADLRRPLPPEPLSEAACQAVRRLVDRVGGLSPGAADEVDDRPTVRADPARWGDYRPLEKLGQGGMGAVYKAVHTRLGKTVAVKVLAPGRAGDPRAVARLRREMQALGGLRHPNIVQAHDAREEDGVPFLVMEYVEGTDLARLLDRSGPLPVADACEVLRQAALGLQYVYEARGIVHRDVKPSNLMVTAEGGVKVLDLGLARFHRDVAAGAGPAGGAQSSGDHMVGTVDYMAPEQWLDGRVDVRADVYSLGCTLYHLLAGRPPFAGAGYETAGRKMEAHAHAPAPPIRGRRPEVPDGLAAVLARLLAKDPAARFATPAEVAEALRPFTAGCALSRLVTSAGAAPAAPAAAAPPPPPGPNEPPRPPAQGRAVLGKFGLGVALAAALIAAAVLGAIRVFGSPGPVPTATMEIGHWDGDKKPLGLLGKHSPAARCDDLVRVRVRFNRPSYCYLVGYLTDGRELLCYPDGGATPPEKVEEVVYPRDGAWAYRLTDGPGVQAFVVVAARRRLPPYAEWKRRAGEVPWKRFEADAAWTSDGARCDPLDNPLRAAEPLHDWPGPFADACQFLKGGPGVEAVRGVAFPVREKLPKAGP
jgi:hypothetical protein